MKFYYLSIIILLTVSCSNELAEKPHAGGTPIGIGEISTRSDGTPTWVWAAKRSVDRNRSTA